MFPSELNLHYASAEVISDGGTLPAKTVSQAGTASTVPLVSVSSDPDWAGCIGWFDEDTKTTALRGVWFSVNSADADTLYLNADLPVAPAAGDTFRIVAGMRYATDTIVPSCRVNSFVAETQGGVVLRDLSNITIKQVRSNVDIYIQYYADDDVVRISTDEVNWGVAVDVSSDVSNGYLQTPSGEWLCVDVQSGAFPSGSLTEQIMVSELFCSVLAPYWLNSENENDIVHSFFVLKNGSEETKDIQAKVDVVGSATVASAYTDGESFIDVSAIDELPARDFWLYLNSGAGDLRYVMQRAGSRCYIADTSQWQEVPFSAGSIEPIVGSVISAGSTSGVLRAVYVTGGSWAGDDVTGTFIISEADGIFGVGETITQSTNNIATVSSNGTWAMRGIERTSSWLSGSSVLVYPSIDVATISPSSGIEFPVVDGAMQTVYVDALFSAWTNDDEVWDGVIKNGFTSADALGIIIRRILLDDLRGEVQWLETLYWDWS